MKPKSKRATHSVQMAKKQPVFQKKSTLPTKSTLFERIEIFLGKKDFIFFWIIFGITALVSILLYDLRVSLTGDDSSYILRANDFLKKFSYPTFQGPLYPIILAPIIAIFGVSLFPLKLFSLVSMLAFMFITFITFRKRIPSVLLFISLLLVSINSFVLYYSSQTYSEAFYMFMQSLVLLVLFRYFVDEQTDKPTFVSSFKHHFLLALTILGAALTRSVGFALLIGVCGYFLFYKRWKDLGFILVIFSAIYLLYTGIIRLIWSNIGFQTSAQGAGLLRKDYYRPELGNEDFGGILIRFWENSVQYLSNGLLRIMGFNYEIGDNSAFFTLLVYGIAIAALVFTYKKNKSIFATIMLAGAFLLTTFIILQSFWNQERLIIPVYLYLILLIFAFLYYLLSMPKLKSLQFLLFIPLFILIIVGLRTTSTSVSAVQKIVNEYSGLTPDWLNYMKASNWAGNNLSEGDLVACRKASISSVYGNGKDFYGIFSVPFVASEDILNEWSAEPEKYVAIPANDQNYRFYNQLLRPHYRARLDSQLGAFWILYNSNELQNNTKQHNIQQISWSDIDAILKQDNANIRFHQADSLLVPFRKNNVTHVMTANLRIDPRQNTGQIVSTVERYSYYIQEKYPNIFELIHQEGREDNEPAKIYKIKWKVVGE